ncbi:MAG: GIY-YIG nuclease family protein [Oscillospiraceae bacterium]|nr:GIY-YIG nuclease family protein [Oscillospiraceae bacterium]
MNWYTYMVRCRDGSLYTGYTNDVKQREKVHNTGKGAKYTKSRLPVSLVYYEEFADKSQALKRECAIKKLTKAQKEALITGKEPL